MPFSPVTPILMELSALPTTRSNMSACHPCRKGFIQQPTPIPAYCCLLLPRGTHKSLRENRKDGRGGGDRTHRRISGFLWHCFYAATNQSKEIGRRSVAPGPPGTFLSPGCFLRQRGPEEDFPQQCRIDARESASSSGIKVNRELEDFVLRHIRNVKKL